MQKTGVLHNIPGHALAALIHGCCVYIFFQLAKAFGADYSSLENSSVVRRILLALFPIFGTWTWCNLGFGGAWQIALGIALLGETAALYFTLVRPSPFIAGAFFALAFGNRTELLITLPFYLYLFWRQLNIVGQAPRLPELGNPESVRGRPTASAPSASHSDNPKGAAAGWRKLKK